MNDYKTPREVITVLFQIAESTVKKHVPTNEQRVILNLLEYGLSAAYAHAPANSPNSRNIISPKRLIDMWPDREEFQNLLKVIEMSGDHEVSLLLMRAKDIRESKAPGFDLSVF